MTPEQNRLFEMLEELVELFKEHDLTYYVAGGTTLGAMRHKGFIPWDDDIDIMMPRNDWARFVEIARDGGLPKNRVLNCIDLDENYLHVFGRYTDTTSCAIHYNQLLGGTPEGFIIDIFILDPVPDAEESFQEHRKVLSLYNDLANDVGYSYPMSQDKKLLQRYMQRIKKEGRRAVFQELDAQLSQYKDQDCDYLVMRWAAAPRLFKKDIYAYRRCEPFEGLPVSVPGKCADYLVQHYGDDWMYIPSGAGRITHDNITFLDIDFQTFQNDYLPFLDVERSRKAFLNRRAYHIRYMNDLRRAEELKARICASFARQATMKRYETCAKNDPALKNADRNKIDWIFGEFYKWQNAPELAGREEYLTINRYYDPIYIDIGDDLLRIALLNLLDTNRVAKASRILTIRERVLGELPASLASVRQQIDLVKLPPSLMDVGCFQEAVDFANYTLEKRPENFSNRVFYCESLYREENFDALETVAEAGETLFPDAGEFKKYQADCRYHSATTASERHAALNDYLPALKQTTQNALVEDVRQKALCETDALDEDLKRLLNHADGEAVQAIPKSQPSFDAQTLASKTCNLLEELADICEQEGIRYYLGMNTCRLAYACGNNKPGYLMLDLLVPASQLSQLVDALKARKRGDRALDYWGNNKNYLSYQVDYVDTTTMFLQLDEGPNVQAHGVKVAIVPIRSHIEGGKGARLDLMETGWEINGYQLTKRITGKRAMAAGVARCAMAIGRKRLANNLYNSFNHAYAPQSNNVAIRYPNHEPIVCDASSFGDSESVEFCGRSYPVPRNCRALLDRFVGPNWETATLSEKPQYKNTLISADMSYKEFLDNLQQDGLAINILFTLMKRIRISMLPMANDLRIRNRVMNIAARSEDRKRLYDSLHVRHDEISALVDASDYESLEPIFRDYKQAALKYLRQGLGLCPCKEYLDVLCEILRREGEGEKAARLLALAPTEHYTPLGR